MFRSKEDKRLEKFIISMATRAARVYSSRCQDVDDYIQEGYVALLEAKKQWLKHQNGSFLPYAFVAIARRIRTCAIESTCVCSAPYRVKLLLLKIRARFNSGWSIDELMEQLQITTEERILLRPLLEIPLSMEMFHEIPDSSEIPYNVVEDLLQSNFLSDGEFLLLIDKIQDALDSSDTNAYRKLSVVQSKLTKCGYGGGD